MHAELDVDLLDLARAELDEQLPEPSVGGITTLELDDLLLGANFKFLIILEADLCLFVKHGEVNDVRDRRGVLWIEGGVRIFQVRNQHTELGAPVTDMVHALHVVAAEFANSTQAVADDR